ncbi:MAG TPA: hypothetical protein VFN39_02870 [Gemmatimonadaceae bacterium]|nr:hypothetical protein [Gemmatimonadaceae bacterium]
MTETSPDEHFEPAQSTAEELERAREELARHLEEACATPVVHGAETTGQLRRLDDALLAAARTTEGLIALKQKAREEHEERAVAQGATAAANGGSTEAEGGGHVERIREFKDRNGCEWRAWAVTPGQASTTSTRNLGDLRNGWLAFESLSGTGKRRLIDFPQDWMTLSDAELEGLLDRATAAPVRKRAAGPDATPPQ